MTPRIRTALLAITAIGFCMLRAEGKAASHVCRDHSQHASQTPYETHLLLRTSIANLEESVDAENQEENVDDYQMSGTPQGYLQKLIQAGKLQLVASDDSDEGDESDESAENAAQLEAFLQWKQQEKEAVENADDDFDDGENEHRSKPKPWRKVQRIVRRQLIKVPKRYLKKFIRQIGLKRQLRAASRSGGDFVALPIAAKQLSPTTSSVQEVGILLREANRQSGETEYFLYQNK